MIFVCSRIKDRQRYYIFSLREENKTHFRIHSMQMDEQQILSDLENMFKHKKQEDGTYILSDEDMNTISRYSMHKNESFYKKRKSR